MRRVVIGALAVLAASGGHAAQKKAPPPPVAPPEPPLVASVDGLPIGNIPRQTLPPGKCAAFLWTQGDGHALVAMISADPAFIRYAPGGVVTDLARTAVAEPGRLGVPSRGSYAAGDAAVTTDLTMEDRADIQNGAVIPAGTISIGKTGGDVVVVPVVGLIGCGQE